MNVSAAGNETMIDEITATSVFAESNETMVEGIMVALSTGVYRPRTEIHSPHLFQGSHCRLDAFHESNFDAAFRGSYSRVSDQPTVCFVPWEESTLGKFLFRRIATKAATNLERL